MRPPCCKIVWTPVAGDGQDGRRGDHAAAGTIATWFRLPAGPETGYYGVNQGAGHPYGKCRLKSLNSFRAERLAPQEDGVAKSIATVDLHFRDGISCLPAGLRACREEACGPADNEWRI